MYLNYISRRTQDDFAANAVNVSDKYADFISVLEACELLITSGFLKSFQRDLGNVTMLTVSFRPAVRIRT